jgi:hypothetical protein
LLAVVCVPQSWLDGSLDADQAMALLEADTSQPMLVEVTASQQARTEDALLEQQVDAAEQEAARLEQVALIEQKAHAKAAVEARAKAQAAAKARAEAQAKAEAAAEKMAKQAAAQVEAEELQKADSLIEAYSQQVAKEAREKAAKSAPIEISPEELPALMEMAAQARAKARSKQHVQWRNRAPHRRLRYGERRHSIRAEREKLLRQSRIDANYKENLRKLKVRREHWSMPHEDHMAETVHHTQRVAAAQHGIRKDADGAMTSEEAQVESLLQINAQPLVSLRHVNNIHAKLTPELLHGTGLNNEANRRATSAALQAKKENHPQAPAFIPLPPTAGSNQQREVSFVVQREEARPAYAGPALQGLPSAAAAEPAVRGGLMAAAPAAPQQELAPEESFVRGLPQAFMELDAATQVQILALADAGVDLDEEEKPQAKATPAAKPEAKQAEQQPAAASQATATSAVDETELMEAASSLKALAELQKESHIPFAKLVHLLSQRK